MLIAASAAAIALSSGHAAGQAGFVRVWNEDGLDGVEIPPPGAFKQLSAGDKFLMGIRVDGSVHVRSGVQSEVPSGNLTNGPFVQVSASWRHGLALRSDETSDPAQAWTVVGWGVNSAGETGAWPPDAPNPPENGVRLLPADEKFYKVSAGEYFSAGLVRDPGNPARDRTLKMWGFKCLTEVPPVGIKFCDGPGAEPATKFIDVVAGGHHFIGIVDDGTGTKGTSSVGVIGTTASRVE